jgi:hypothetical protein
MIVFSRKDAKSQRKGQELASASSKKKNGILRLTASRRRQRFVGRKRRCLWLALNDSDQAPSQILTLTEQRRRETNLG